MAKYENISAFYSELFQQKDSDENIMSAFQKDIDESNKLLIFGHSSPSYFLPIMIIENYKDEDYYKEHKYICLSSIKEVKKLYALKN